MMFDGCMASYNMGHMGDHSPIVGRLDCSQFLAIISSAIMNIYLGTK